MSTSKTLAALPATSDVGEWSDEDKAIIEASGLVFVHQYGENKGQKILAPRAVIARFLHTCERTGLDPLAKQIYCIARFGRDGLEWSIQTAIDGFRVVAERSKKYAGQDAAEWLTAKGEWVPVFVKALHGDVPLAARVSVYRHDWADTKPAVGVATWDEYAQYTRKGDLTSMWAQRGPGQLAKCAEALALRKAFPQDLSGVYTDDERAPEVIEVAEVSEDWGALIQAAGSVEALAEVGNRLTDAGEVTEKIGAAYRARMAVLMSAANTVDAEVVDEPAEPAELPEDDYEAQVAAEFDAAVERGEVSGD